MSFSKAREDPELAWLYDFSKPIPTLNEVASMDLSKQDGSWAEELENFNSEIIDTEAQNASPIFEKLETGTDLKEQPRRWLVPVEYASKEDPYLNTCNSIWQDSYGLKEFSLSCLLDAPVEKQPDFLSSTSDMKSIFKAGEKSELSLKVNKIGDTLMINQVKPEEANLSTLSDVSQEDRD